MSSWQSADGLTRFHQRDDTMCVEQVCGMACHAMPPEHVSFEARGLWNITAEGQPAKTVQRLIRCNADRDHMQMHWTTGTLEPLCRWEYDSQTHILSRRDTITNISDHDVTLAGIAMRVCLASDMYEYYSQTSRWCAENQGLWQQLRDTSVVLGCEGGRTNQGNAPYVCIRSIHSQQGMSLRIAPRGNWQIRLRLVNLPPGAATPPLLVIEAGWPDHDFSMELSAGASVVLPELYFQPLTTESQEHTTSDWLQYLQTHNIYTPKHDPPVVYNTWFDAFADISEMQCRRQLAAARDVGCEMFVVDAGWYGRSEGSWSQQTGDWREKKDGAFYGKMKQFADEVRSEGLGFGLWVEPERLCPNVPVLNEHPDWFLPGAGGCYYPDLSNPQAYQYILSEMCRLIDTYEANWLKVDFNFSLECDPHGRQFEQYYDRWYTLMDTLRSRYPRCWFEGCASGGARLDISTLRHFDSHFLSDNVEPVSVLRMFQGAAHYLPPGWLGKWVVLRSLGDASMPAEGSAARTILTPDGATWNNVVSTDLDFAALVAMPGSFGISGDLAGLVPNDRIQLSRHIEFYKTWRSFIRRSSIRLLTPVHDIDDRTGWIAFQLSVHGDDRHLVFVYRLGDSSPRMNFKLCNLCRDTIYTVISHPGDATFEESGWALHSAGLNIELPDTFVARAYTVCA